MLFESIERIQENTLDEFISDGHYEPYTGIVLDKTHNQFKIVSGQFTDKKDFYTKMSKKGLILRKCFEKKVWDWMEKNAPDNVIAYLMFSTAFSKWRNNNILADYYVKLLNDIPQLNRERDKGNPNTKGKATKPWGESINIKKELKTLLEDIENNSFFDADAEDFEDILTKEKAEAYLNTSGDFVKITLYPTLNGASVDKDATETYVTYKRPNELPNGESQEAIPGPKTKTKIKVFPSGYLTDSEEDRKALIDTPYINKLLYDSFVNEWYPGGKGLKNIYYDKSTGQTYDGIAVQIGNDKANLIHFTQNELEAIKPEKLDNKEYDYGKVSTVSDNLKERYNAASNLLNLLNTKDKLKERLAVYKDIFGSDQTDLEKSRLTKTLHMALKDPDNEAIYTYGTLNAQDKEEAKRKLIAISKELQYKVNEYTNELNDFALNFSDTDNNSGIESDEVKDKKEEFSEINETLNEYKAALTKIKTLLGNFDNSSINFKDFFAKINDLKELFKLNIRFIEDDIKDIDRELVTNKSFKEFSTNGNNTFSKNYINKCKNLLKYQVVNQNLGAKPYIFGKTDLLDYYQIEDKMSLYKIMQLILSNPDNEANIKLFMENKDKFSKDFVSYVEDAIGIGDEEFSSEVSDALREALTDDLNANIKALNLKENELYTTNLDSYEIKDNLKFYEKLENFYNNLVYSDIDNSLNEFYANNKLNRDEHEFLNNLANELKSKYIKFKKNAVKNTSSEEEATSQANEKLKEEVTKLKEILAKSKVALESYAQNTKMRKEIKNKMQALNIDGRIRSSYSDYTNLNDEDTISTTKETSFLNMLTELSMLYKLATALGIMQYKDENVKNKEIYKELLTTISDINTKYEQTNNYKELFKLYDNRGSILFKCLDDSKYSENPVIQNIINYIYEALNNSKSLQGEAEYLNTKLTNMLDRGEKVQSNLERKHRINDIKNFNQITGLKFSDKLTKEQLEEALLKVKQAIFSITKENKGNFNRYYNIADIAFDKRIEQLDKYKKAAQVIANELERKTGDKVNYSKDLNDIYDAVNNYKNNYSDDISLHKVIVGTIEKIIKKKGLKVFPFNIYKVVSSFYDSFKEINTNEEREAIKSDYIKNIDKFINDFVEFYNKFIKNISFRDYVYNCYEFTKEKKYDDILTYLFNSEKAKKSDNEDNTNTDTNNTEKKPEIDEKVLNSVKNDYNAFRSITLSFADFDNVKAAFERKKNALKNIYNTIKPTTESSEDFSESFVNDGVYATYMRMPSGESYKPTIEEGFTHSNLAKELFENDKLKPEIKTCMLKIAKMFATKLDISLKPIDVYFTGSYANYNYNDKSDIDLHLVYNFEEAGINSNLLIKYLNTSKKLFNDKYNIKIKNIPVEVGCENINEPLITTGVYSLRYDKWIKKSENAGLEIPDADENKVNDFKNFIDNAIKSNNSKNIDKVKDKLYSLRKNSLASEGEFGMGNLVFKNLRNSDYISKLKDAYYDVLSKELSMK